jgi:hypothetical protein
MYAHPLAVIILKHSPHCTVLKYWLLQFTPVTAAINGLACLALLHHGDVVAQYDLSGVRRADRTVALIAGKQAAGRIGGIQYLTEECCHRTVAEYSTSGGLSCQCNQFAFYAPCCKRGCMYARCSTGTSTSPNLHCKPHNLEECLISGQSSMLANMSVSRTCLQAPEVWCRCWYPLSSCCRFELISEEASAYAPSCGFSCGLWVIVYPSMVMTEQQSGKKPDIGVNKLS